MEDNSPYVSQHELLDCSMYLLREQTTV